MMKRNLLFTSLLMLCLPGASARAAETVVRVTDINPGALSAYPSHLTVFQGQLHFRALTGQLDVELWRFDGSEASRVADIVPGPEGSSPANLAELDGVLYFDARVVGGPTRVHRYDGSQVVALSTNPRAFYGSGRWQPVVWRSELWLTEEGRLTSFNGLRFAFQEAPPWVSSPPVLFQDSLYYRAQESSYGDELWRFDGTTQERVSDINPGPLESYPENLFVHQGALHFRARDGQSGMELWRYDGTEVELVADINPGPADANPGGFVTFQDALYFAADDGEHGTELFRWNGTHVGLAADINPNPVYEEGGDRLSDSVPQQLTVLGEALYFIASDGTTRGIWRFDGTTASILGGGLLNNVSEIVLCNDELYFDADDGLWGRELWKIEKTPTPTLSIDLTPGGVRVILSEVETGRFVTEVAAGLAQWQPVATNQPVDGQIVLWDGQATNPAPRFYRTVRTE